MGIISASTPCRESGPEPTPGGTCSDPNPQNPDQQRFSNQAGPQEPERLSAPCSDKDSTLPVSDPKAAGPQAPNSQLSEATNPKPKRDDIFDAGPGLIELLSARGESTKFSDEED